VEPIEERLTALSGLMRERELLDARRTWFGDLCAAAEAEVGALRKTSDAEQKDVERLEGVSLARVLVAIRGSHQDALARERAEAESARYRWIVAHDRLSGLRGELASVEGRRAQLEYVPAAYGEVLDEKEAWIRTHGGAGAPALWQLAAERGRVEAELRELDEAARAAVAARRALADTQGHLEAAGDWSAYDTFLGGGLIVSSFKHARLDRADRAAAQADRALAVLRGELADVGAAGPGGIRVDGLTRFTDIWFDNIFTDLAVRDRIKRARRAVAGSLASVIAVQGALKERAEAGRGRLGEIAAARHDLLTR
jgi:hypothetical protein